MALAWTGALDDVPLLNGTAAALIETAGAAALISAWWRRQRRWATRILPAILIGVAAAVGLIAIALWVTGTVTDAYPPSFAVWVGAGFAAIAGFPLVLRHAGTGRPAVWRRTAAALAIPLTLTGAFLRIDQEYGIWPQLGDVLGHSGALDGQHGLHNPPATSAGDQQGVIVDLDAPSTRSHFKHRPGVVFLPPAYYGPDRANLPVLVMLVGAPGTPINWLKSGHGQNTDNAYAATHHGIAPVLVVVDQNGSATADSECVDHAPGAGAETYLATDVPAFITDTLHITHNPAHWGIIGFSEGGTCALDIVLRHPDVYRHLVDLGGDAAPNLGNHAHTLAALYNGSTAAEQAHDPATLLTQHRYPGVTAWFAAGADDTRGITAGKRMAADTAKDGIPTHQFVGIGGHNWQFASDALARIMAQLCDELGCADVNGPAR